MRDMSCLPAGYMNFTIRLVQSGDEEHLHVFYQGLSDRSRHYFEPYSDTSVEGMHAVVERSLAGTDLSFVALEPDGTVLAHFFFMNLEEDAPHLGIGVRDDYQNLGIGTVLLTYLLAIARRALSLRRVGLTVMKENTRAFHLYKHLGFEVVREVTFREKNDSYEMRLNF